jgi:ribosomal protein L37AE/L43A
LFPAPRRGALWYGHIYAHTRCSFYTSLPPPCHSSYRTNPITPAEHCIASAQITGESFFLHKASDVLQLCRNTETTGSANSACWRQNQPPNLSPKCVIIYTSPVGVHLAVSYSSVCATTWGFTVKQVTETGLQTHVEQILHTCNWQRIQSFRSHHPHNGINSWPVPSTVEGRFGGMYCLHVWRTWHHLAFTLIQSFRCHHPHNGINSWPVPSTVEGRFGGMYCLHVWRPWHHLAFTLRCKSNYDSVLRHSFQMF